jgi:hypothetical protein
VATATVAATAVATIPVATVIVATAAVATAAVCFAQIASMTITSSINAATIYIISNNNDNVLPKLLRNPLPAATTATAVAAVYTISDNTNIV